jgi:hypothetical protein
VSSFPCELKLCVVSTFLLWLQYPEQDQAPHRWPIDIGPVDGPQGTDGGTWAICPSCAAAEDQVLESKGRTAKSWEPMVLRAPSHVKAD